MIYSTCTTSIYAFQVLSTMMGDPYRLFWIIHHAKKVLFISSYCNGQAKFIAKDNRTQIVLILAITANVFV